MKGRPGRLRVLQAFRGVTTATRKGPLAQTTYCDLPVELPELEPPELPLVEPEPMPLLEPLLEGVLGEVVELGEVVLLPLAPEPALEPDLLKYASHS